VSNTNHRWQDAERKILERLDLLAEYRTLGLDITGNQPSPSGWVACRCYGREDRTPSAGICVSGDYPRLGRYREFSGEAESLSFWQFAAKAGPYEDWRAARRHYARQAGVSLPRGPQAKQPQDQLVFRTWNEHLVRAWCLHKPPIAHWAVRIAGGRLAGWPAKSQRFTVVALPVYGEHLIDAEPIGWVFWNKSGRDLPHFQGQGREPVMRKMLTASGSKGGWMNRFGLANLEQAETVWKVEGPGDMLALQSLIPRDRLHADIVITNSGGGMEVPRPEMLAPLAGKRVNVVGDLDQAGQAGARRWAEAIATVAESSNLVRLPGEIQEKHGVDLRDLLST